jgi:hypothetical protein
LVKIKIVKVLLLFSFCNSPSTFYFIPFTNNKMQKHKTYMKQLTLTLLMFFTLAMTSLSATNLSVIGLVIDNNGDPVVGLDVDIAIDSSGTSGFSYFNTVTTDASGTFIDDIDVPDNLSQGVVTFGYTDCDGSYATATAFWTPLQTDIFVTFSYCANTFACDVSISADSLPNGGVMVWELTANATGEAPFTYAWSTGETTSSIIVDPNNSGYCVTITDASGCVAEDCFYFNFPPACQAFISPSPIGGLVAIAIGGTSPYTYSWNTGETTETIFPSEAGDYCVTITDAEGCEAEACEYYDPNPIDSFCVVELIPVQGGYCLEALAYGTPPFAYSWNDGQTGQVACFNALGEYCVTVTDATGCTAEACYDNNQQDPCSVEILVETNPVGNEAWLDAYAGGVPPFSYAWSTGETTQFINVTQDGTYCVTITDALGCEASACATVVFPGCGVSVYQNSLETLTASPYGGTAPYTYLWDTGETTQSISPANAGTYCVTIADANGCTATGCGWFDPNGQDSLIVITGNVFLTNPAGGNANTGLAYLIEYDANAGTLTAIDTTELQPIQGSTLLAYYFGGFLQGEYLVKVALDPSSPDYATHLPTYYGDVLYWDEASYIDPWSNPNQFYDITMVTGNNPGGPGFIGGLVSEGANLKADDDTEGEGDPIADMEILLLYENGNGVTHIRTDEEGKFEFDNLDWGTYMVMMEVPGMERAWYLVTLSPDNPMVEGLSFELNETDITITATNKLEQARFEVMLFPNPVTDKVMVQLEDLPAGNTELLLRNAQGQLLQQFQEKTSGGAFSAEFQLGDMPSGLYWIEINTVNGRVVEKLIKL